ncbi:MAG: hypothetical protein A2Z88_04555 [Omnitrophica WOR_2 bacterium GWA2_47_8]|nr:MAG: hypothetical protein A2Z88_04555 [Omnitrophica WOR_2 bacterium GWA2_47_8]
MKDLKTIILAAGKGTRMRSGLPKVLHPICGQAMIQYVLDLSRRVGSLKTYAVLGHKYQEVKAYLGKNAEIVLQKKLLGTADAVKYTERYLKNHKGHVLILCGDTPLLREETVKRLLRKHRASNAACTLLTAVVHEPFGYGRIIKGEHGEVLAVREEKDASDFERNIAEINVGVYCFKAPELFKALKLVKANPKKKEFYLTDIIEIFREQNLEVVAVEAEDAREGLGVNSREDLAFAESVHRGRILKRLMDAGVTIVAPQTTYIDSDVKIGQDTVIKPFTVIEQNVRIGKNCSIGPFARIRPGTRIADAVEIGNFTEVSRSRLDKRTVMKHFSFLGDARVGSSVNIGAGTVTANYDGQNKNVTQISSNAFIGSDSILVAPVRIGKGATTAAGAVVVKNTRVPDGGLVMGIPARIIKRKK